MPRKRSFDHDHPNPFGVKQGQVWQLLDPRYPGRSVKILLVNESMGYAVVERLANNRLSQIKLKRFRPMTNGYKLLRDA